MKKKKIIDDSYELDEYEQEIMDNIELAGSYSPEVEKMKIAELVEMAKAHVAARTHVGLDMHTRDLAIVKYRSSKLGIPYKEIINMIVHKYVTSPQEEI